MRVFTKSIWGCVRGLLGLALAKPWLPSPIPNKQGMEAHTSNSYTWEEEAEGSQEDQSSKSSLAVQSVWGQQGLDETICQTSKAQGSCPKREKKDGKSQRFWMTLARQCFQTQQDTCTHKLRVIVTVYTRHFYDQVRQKSQHGLGRQSGNPTPSWRAMNNW